MSLRDSNLDEFIMKARKLEKSSFWAWTNTTPIRADVERVRAGDWLAYDGLREEELEAFCLTLRLLIQDRDGLSIRRIAAQVSTWPGKFEEYKAAIAQATLDLHRRLDKVILSSALLGGPTTHRELFDIVFYGGLVHSDQQKRHQFAALTADNQLSQVVFPAFWSTLFDYRNCIQTIAHHVAHAVSVEDEEDA